ncbi:MAG: hypothetical protein ACK5M7_13730 [Draconibacterium sp.]
MQKYSLLTFFILLLLYPGFVKAQIETTILNKDIVQEPGKVPFFTNRQIVVNQDNTFSFKNSTTKQTNTLYFCNYNYDTDSIELHYRAINFSDNYPTEKIPHNILYDIYEYHVLQRGVKNFYIVVGGYGKSFEKQVNSYMKRMKAVYGDSLLNSAVVSVFAWGTEDHAYRYYNGLRASKRGASDFAIFQHMLDEFVSDTAYFKTHTADLTISILFSSMANELFRQYIINREKQGIPLVKTYHNITFVGSVAPRNVFEEGQPFHNLDQMADEVYLAVNSKDILLKMSSLAHLKNRIGNSGPKHPDLVPDFVKVFDLRGLITKDDMKRMGHDYVLTNPVVQDELLQQMEQSIDSK